MEHSILTSISRGLVVPSPHHPLLGSANGNCLDIHDLHTLTLLHTVTTADPITSLSWGFSRTHGPLIAAASSPSNCVVVVAARSGDVILDVHDSPLPLDSISLSMDAALLLVAEHGISLTLVDIAAATPLVELPFPKPRMHAAPLHAWTPRGTLLAAVTRVAGVDGLTILAAATGHILAALHGPDALAGITDVAGLAWQPDASGVLVWGAPTDPLASAALALIAVDGCVIRSGAPREAPADSHSLRDSDDGLVWAGECGEPYAGAEEAREERGTLGISTVAVSTDGRMAAVGGCDGVLRLVNVDTWVVVKKLGHERPEVCAEAPPVVFRERGKVVADEGEEGGGGGGGGGGRGGGSGGGDENCGSEPNVEKTKRKGWTRQSYFETVGAEGSVEIGKRVRSAGSGKHVRGGVSYAEFSACGTLMASRADKASNVVLVWDVCRVRLTAVVILEADARSIQWSRCGGEEAQLAVGCGGGHVYLWRRGGAAAVRLNAAQRWRGEFGGRKVCWGQGDGGLVVADGVGAKAFLVVYT